MFLKLPQPPECTRPQQPRLHRTPKPSQLPFTSSLHPIWLAPPRSLGQGVVESSLAFLANDAPPLTHSPSCTHTHTPSSSQTKCCSQGWAPLAAPHWGESPTDTFLFPHAPRRWLTGWSTEAPPRSALQALPLTHTYSRRMMAQIKVKL